MHHAHELFERAHYDIFATTLLNDLLVLLLMFGLTTFGRLQFNGKVRVELVTMQEDEVREPSTHTHCLALRSVAVVLHQQALIGRMVEQQLQFRILHIKPRLTGYL